MFLWQLLIEMINVTNPPGGCKHGVEILWLMVLEFHGGNAFLTLVHGNKRQVDFETGKMIYLTFLIR